MDLAHSIALGVATNTSIHATSLHNEQSHNTSWYNISNSTEPLYATVVNDTINELTPVVQAYPVDTLQIPEAICVNIDVIDDDIDNINLRTTLTQCNSETGIEQFSKNTKKKNNNTGIEQFSKQQKYKLFSSSTKQKSKPVRKKIKKKSKSKSKSKPVRKTIKKKSRSKPLKKSTESRFVTAMKNFL